MKGIEVLAFGLFIVCVCLVLALAGGSVLSQCQGSPMTDPGYIPPTPPAWATVW